MPDENKNAFTISIRAAGLYRKEDKILFVKHRKGNNTYYLLPGGNIEYGEKIQKALEREFQEELCLSVKTGDLICVSESISPQGSRHIIQIIFEVSVKSGELKVGLDKAVIDYCYMDLDQIRRERIYPNLKKIFIDTLKGKKIKPSYNNIPWEN